MLTLAIRISLNHYNRWFNGSAAYKANHKPQCRVTSDPGSALFHERETGCEKTQLQHQIFLLSPLRVWSARNTPHAGMPWHQQLLLFAPTHWFLAVSEIPEDCLPVAKPYPWLVCDAQHTCELGAKEMSADKCDSSMSPAPSGAPRQGERWMKLFVGWLLSFGEYWEVDHGYHSWHRHRRSVLLRSATVYFVELKSNVAVLFV